jgi:hypothetical protein
LCTPNSRNIFVEFSGWTLNGPEDGSGYMCCDYASYIQYGYQFSDDDGTSSAPLLGRYRLILEVVLPFDYEGLCIPIQRSPG